MSLDAFRGLTIASMMLVNNPGSWDHVYAPLRHAEWHGWTFTDTVFPFFLWIVGVAMTLSFARRLGEGRSLLPHVLRRSAIIFGLGLLLNGFPYYNLATMRIPGVLQRIAVCYLIAAIVFVYVSWRGQMLVAAGLLLGYWGVMSMGPSLEKGANFAEQVDTLFLSGHMWSATKTWDPEGIVSTLPAIATVLFGVLAGHLLRSGLPLLDKVGWLMVGGNALIFAGLVWDKVLPVNKNLWTSSFTVLMAGLAMVVFGCCYWLIDVKGWRRWAGPFVIYGSNAIAVYVVAGLFARMMGLLQWKRPVYEALLEMASPVNASLLYAAGNVLLLYLVALGLYRRGWFLRF